jgi:hypothetical protein
MAMIDVAPTGTPLTVGDGTMVYGNAAASYISFSDEY